MSTTMNKLCLIFVALAMLTLAGCGGDPQASETRPSSGHPSPTVAVSPTPAAAPPVQSAAPTVVTLVGISDSLVGGDPGDIGDRYARLIEADLDVVVSIRWFFYGGSTSSFVLDRIRTDTTLRDALASADVIVFNVPLGALKDVCPWEDADYQPAPGSPEEYRQCGAAMAAAYAADAEAIMSEIDALRRPDALVRTTNSYVLFYPRFEDLGLADVVVDNFRSINAALEAAAEDHGIPVADAFTAFMGVDGTADPVAEGYVSADQMHATSAGGQRLAELWRDLGYER